MKELNIMQNTQIPAGTPGNTGATEQATVLDGRIKKTQLWITVDDAPRACFGKKGSFVVTKTALTLETLKALPYIGSKDFETLDEALDESDGSIHLVSWTADGNPFKAIFKKTGLMLGDWLVSTRGITASRWNNETTGDSGVKYKFCGLNLVKYGETTVELDIDELLAKPEESDEDDSAEAEG